MKTKLFPLVIILVLMMFSAFAPALAQTATGTVNTGNLNVRSGPGVSYGILATVARGNVVTVVGRNNASTWAQVITATGVNGWVNASYLILSASISTLPITDGSNITGTMTGANHLNVRSGPGVGYSILTRLDYSNVVNVLGRNANSSWVQVSTYYGIIGWANASYFTYSASIASLPVTDGGVVAPPPTGGPVTGQRIHVVQAGENLYRISRIYGVNMWDIAQANGILNLNQIYAGQRLVIP
jgi:N-acetylmuramoyl-L-alanine amidase